MDIKNKKGFTLVELLAVIVILVSISFVAVSGISSSLENRDIKECKEQQELAIGAAKIYFSLNKSSIVSVKNLKDGKYLNDGNKTSKLNDDDIIKMTEDGYIYNGRKVGESCE